MNIKERGERLGMLVRKVWVAWAKEQPNPKASWLVPWEQLPEPDREVDRRIGLAIWADTIAENADAIASHVLHAAPNQGNRRTERR